MRRAIVIALQLGLGRGSRSNPIAFSLAILLAACGAAPSNAATFVVTSPVDGVDLSPGDGVCAAFLVGCTLRAAIMETNGLLGADHVTLADGTYVLALEGRDEDGSLTGDLDINDSLTISAARGATAIVDADGIDRVFHVPVTFITVTFAGLTIRGGDASVGGAGIWTMSNTTVNRCIVEDNVASGEPPTIPETPTGGVSAFGSGDLTLLDTTVRNNQGKWVE